MSIRILNRVLGSILLIWSTGLPAHAQSDSPSSDSSSAWEKMRAEAVPASQILRGNVRSGLNPVAQVENLVLDKNGTSVQYIVFEADRVLFEYYIGGGYVSYNAIDLESAASLGEIDVRIGDEPVRGPEEIEITADEAEYRLVSRIIESRLELKGPQYYEIEELLIHPETGAITHYVIGTAENAIFSEERRAVPASEVEFRNGEFRTDMTFEEIESRQPYDTGLL